MRKNSFRGKIRNINGLDISYSLSIITFEEDGAFICYCPALDIYGYGYTEEEARNSLEFTLGTYFDYTTKKKTIAQDLRRLGWNFKNAVTKKLIPPTMTHLLETNRVFRNVFDNYNYKKSATTVHIPAFA